MGFNLITKKNEIDMSPYSVTVNIVDQLNFSVNYGNNRVLTKVNIYGRLSQAFDCIYYRVAKYGC